jgi:hypothetical protein
MNLLKKWFLYQEEFFNIFIILTYVLLIISYLGFLKSAPNYLNDVNYYIKIYICLFLIIRFNPFARITEFTNLDRKIAFSSGLLILTTTVLNQYLVDTTEKIKNTIIDKF